MSFIGFYEEKKQEKMLEQELSKVINNATLIAINKKSIENIKNVKFETIIINHHLKDIQDKEELKRIIANTKYVIINSDDVDLSILQNLNVLSITYGFNNKSTVTMSSIENEKLVLCLQRNIKTINNKIIEPQEISIDMEKYKIDKYSIISLYIIKVLYEKL